VRTRENEGTERESASPDMSIPLKLFVDGLSTGGPDVEYDDNNILAVYKTMYENASKITLNAMCRK